MAKTPTPPRDYTELTKKLFEMGLRPKPQTDAELADRINEYFDFCHDHEFQINWQSLVAYCSLTMQEARDIANGLNNSIIGGGAARILMHAGEVCTAIDALRVGDGTHKAPVWAMFDKKQPNPGGGYMDTPPVILATPDALAVKGADLKQLREKYGEYAPNKKTKAAEVIEVQDGNGNRT